MSKWVPPSVLQRHLASALGRLITEHRPDVLHLHNPYPLLSPWVVRTAHKHGVPVVQTVSVELETTSPGFAPRRYIDHGSGRKAAANQPVQGVA
ncbi:glycosyltransferase [Micromonospora rubida]